MRVMETLTSEMPAPIRRRKAGARPLFATNNFVAGAGRGNAKGAGAPKGNRNAMTHGARTAERRALALRVRIGIAQLALSVARAKV